MAWLEAGLALVGMVVGVASFLVAPFVLFFPRPTDDASTDAKLRVRRQWCARMLTLAPALFFSGVVVFNSLKDDGLALPLLCAAAFAGLLSAMFWSFSATLLANPVAVPGSGSTPGPSVISTPSPLIASPPIPAALAQPATPVAAASSKRHALISAGDNGLDQAEAAKVNGSAAVMAGISVILALAASTLPTAVPLMVLTGTPAEHLILLAAKHGYGKVSGSLVVVACCLYLVSFPILAFSAAVCIENIGLQAAAAKTKLKKLRGSVRIFYVFVILLFVAAFLQHQFAGCWPMWRSAGLGRCQTVH